MLKAIKIHNESVKDEWKFDLLKCIMPPELARQQWSYWGGRSILDYQT